MRAHCCAATSRSSRTSRSPTCRAAINPAPGGNPSPHSSPTWTSWATQARWASNIDHRAPPTKALPGLLAIAARRTNSAIIATVGGSFGWNVVRLGACEPHPLSIHTVCDPNGRNQQAPIYRRSLGRDGARDRGDPSPPPSHPEGNRPGLRRDTFDQPILGNRGGRRSDYRRGYVALHLHHESRREADHGEELQAVARGLVAADRAALRFFTARLSWARSEEHTSELQ